MYYITFALKISFHSYTHTIFLQTALYERKQTAPFLSGQEAAFARKGNVARLHMLHRLLTLLVGKRNRTSLR